MKVSIPIVKKDDDAVHELAVEVEDDVATIYIDNEEVCRTDFENLEDLFTTVGLLWRNWKKKEVKK